MKCKLQISKTISVILLLLSTIQVLSQDYSTRITNIADENGINVASTFSIVEDTDGFIWFGTVDGLYRYNGISFKIFRTVPADTNSLSNNTIRSMAIDKNNKIWIATQGGGLNCFDIYSQKFTRYSLKKIGIPSDLNDNVWAVTIDKQNNIWAGCDNGMLYKFDQTKQQFTHYKLVPQDTTFKGLTTIRHLLYDSKGILWVATNSQGLYGLQPDTKRQFHYYNISGNQHALGNNNLLSVYEDKNHNIWCATYGAGLAKLNRKTNRFIHYRNIRNNPESVISNLGYSVNEMEPGKFWLGTEYGLSVLDTTTNTCKHFVQERFSFNGLNDNRVRYVYKDHSGIIWIATEAGVSKMVKNNKFKLYQNNGSNTNTIPVGIVRSIYKTSDGILWIGLIDKGLVKYNPLNDSFTTIAQTITKPPCSYQVTSIFEDNEKNLWIGDWEQGLMLYDRKTNQFKNVVGAFFGAIRLLDNRIQIIKSAGNGLLWLGTETGLHLYDYKKHTLKIFLNDPLNSQTISSNSIQSNAFITDSDTALWIGTWSGGLNYLVFSDQQYTTYTNTRYLQNNNIGYTLNNNNIISLYKQNDSVLWIGTFGGGLNKLNTKTGKIKHFTTENGLPNNVIFGILPDKQGNLWLSTDMGLSLLDIQSEMFHNFTESDGLQNSHFFWGATHRASDGELFFGGIAGLNSFYPDKVVLNTRTPKIFITGISIFNLPYITKTPTPYIKTIVLPYDSNFIDLSFAVLDFSEPTKNKYMVKLENFDKDWISVNFDGNIRYANLPPGKYTFSIHATNTDGFWSIKPHKLEILIKPPWYKTFTAKVLFPIVIIALILFLYYSRINRYNKQRKKLEELVKRRTVEIESQKEELTLALAQLSETQEQLLRSEKMASLGTLVAGIAHEINNPVNFINSGWQIVTEIMQNLFVFINLYFSYPPEFRKKHLPLLFEYENEVDYEFLKNSFSEIHEGIDKGILRTTQIITSLRTYSYTKKDEKSRFNVAQAINDALVILQSNYRNKAVIETHLNSIPDIECNPGQINQLFMNLISNAIDAVPNNGTIIIKATTDKQWLTITIADNGSGIPDEILARIFDPFFTTKEVGKGTGLGLYIAWQIIDSHKGSIVYTPNNPKGTIVTVKLPVS